MNRQRTRPTMILAALLALGLAFGGSHTSALEPSSGPASRPSTPPPATIATWVNQLASDQIATREAAAEHLAKAGPAALPALQQAARGKDPDVAARAAALLAHLAAPPPGPVFRQATLLLASPRPRTIQARVAAVSRNEIEITARSAPGAAILISIDAAGIAVTVRAEIDGRSQTETYRAPSPNALAHPDVQALYDAIVTEAGGGKDQAASFRAWLEHPAPAADRGR